MEVIDRLVGLIEERRTARPRYLVGIDGPDAAGKTTLASQLRSALAPTVVSASVDGFHHPRAVRRAPDRLTADAYYRRTFDLATFRAELVEPFRTGAVTLRTASLDYDTDAVITPRGTVPAAAVLVVDGVFLQRPELGDVWDLVIYLDISPETSQARGLPRDVGAARSHAELLVAYRERYLPGQQLYRDECEPQQRADVLIDNTDVRDPKVLRWPGRRP